MVVLMFSQDKPGNRDFIEQYHSGKNVLIKKT
jgi:hypothetical protein